MTTKLTRPVRRETGSVEPRSRRPFVITLEAGGHLVRIREKGKRTSYTVSYHDIWLAGARNAAVALRAAKEQKKKDRKRC